MPPARPRSVGEYRHRARVARKTNQPDGMGGFTEAWSVVAESYARVQVASAHRVERMGRRVGEASHEVAFRESVTVTVHDRVLVANLKLDVVAVHQDAGKPPIIIGMHREDVDTPGV